MTGKRGNHHVGDGKHQVKRETRAGKRSDEMCPSEGVGGMEQRSERKWMERIRGRRRAGRH